ncbi:MAG: hypothetical protein M1816_000725 [Peltula sp. TS41687]|nr:MAG: hypothetical protein M1816_000725 [Peltula sp. TS41687]
MFFEGDIQSGIATARQESKAVACFIRDDSEKSLQWENELLKEDLIAQELRQKTVLLRMAANSQDAQSFSAFCPIVGAPALLIIKDGTIKGHLTFRHDGDEWRNLVLEALGSEVRMGRPSSPAVQTEVQKEEAEQQQPVDDVDSVSKPAPSTPSEPPSDNNALRPTVDISNNEVASTAATSPPEQQASPEPSRETKKVTEDPQEVARIRARREQAQAEIKDPSFEPKQAGERNHAEELRKRKEQARRERERIMKLVENDRLERRERLERRKMRSRAGSEKSIESSESRLTPSSDAQEPQSSTSTSKQCALQVRLLNGTTLRSRFRSDQTLHKDVRSWIDSNRTDGEAPYNFKQILVPQPNRTLSISDEQETLASLGLTPSATLVLFPVSGYTNAYDGAAAPGILSRGLSAGYGVVSSGVGLIAGALGSLLGSGGQTQRGDSGEQNVNQPGTGSSSGAPHSRTIRVKTLHDQARERGDQQYYNGNQLNFEPNKDEAKSDL